MKAASRGGGGGGEDAWAANQARAFLRWANAKLEPRGITVSRVDRDFCDGTALINLLEVCSGESLGRHCRRPTMKLQRLENCTLALNFLRAHGVRLVNIGPEDIVEGREKLILGLLWSIILHYQIALSGDDGNASASGSGSKSTGANGSSTAASGSSSSESNAKMQLLRWVQTRIPQYAVRNFTSDWQDGRALCALVNAVDATQCRGHAAMSPHTALANARTGIDAAAALGVPRIVEAEELAGPGCDEHALMTYIACFRDMDRRGLFRSRDAALARARGHGLDRAEVDQRCVLDVETARRAPGDAPRLLEIQVEGPSTTAVPEVVRGADGLHKVSFVPHEPGTWRMLVTIDGVPIQGSPFTISVSAPGGSTSTSSSGSGAGSGVSSTARAPAPVPRFVLVHLFFCSLDHCCCDPRVYVHRMTSVTGGQVRSVAVAGSRPPPVPRQRFCTKCGKPTDPSSKYCGSCGTPIAADARPRCPNKACRQFLPPGGCKFCPACGSRI